MASDMTKTITRQGANGKWQWVLQDWFGHTLDAGGGCESKQDARDAAKAAKDKYLNKSENERHPIKPKDQAAWDKRRAEAEGEG